MNVEESCDTRETRPTDLHSKMPEHFLIEAVALIRSRMVSMPRKSCINTSLETDRN